MIWDGSMGTGTARPRPRADGRERSLGRGDLSSIRTRGEDQYESDETTSPPLRVASDHMTAVRLMLLLTKRTLPSQKRRLAPPGW